MKRTPLARGTKQLKRSGFKAKSTSTPKKRATGRLEGNKGKFKDSTKGYKPPKWFQKIKPGGHGSTPAQKRLWRVVSEFVRRRDFELYGTCVSCFHRFENWQEAQAGHWLPYSLCNSFYKFDPTFNIAAQCSACNSNLHRSGAHIGHAMGEELKRRHGQGVLEVIQSDNLRFRGMKMETWAIVDYVARLRPDLTE